MVVRHQQSGRGIFAQLLCFLISPVEKIVRAFRIATIDDVGGLETG
jgi:hypothetical protein